MVRIIASLSCLVVLTRIASRRPTPGNGYLEALLQPNVQVYTDMLQRITEKGFIDADGAEHEVDVFICAT